MKDVRIMRVSNGYVVQSQVDSDDYSVHLTLKKALAKVKGLLSDGEGTTGSEAQEAEE